MTLRAGLVALSDSFGGTNFTFCIPEDVTVPVTDDSAFFENIEIYEGTFLTKEFTVDTSNIDQRFIIPNANVDTSTLVVQVKESSFDISSVKYQLAQSLVDINSLSKIFLLQESADEKFEILFGDGVFGNRLENGNVITSTYVITNGDLGNGASTFTFAGRLVDNDDRVVTTGVSAISVISPAQGVARSNLSILSANMRH